MPGLHALAAPSSLARIVQCHYSMLAALQYADQPPDPTTIEGDAAHWVAAQYAQGFNLFVDKSTAPNGVVVDQDMIDGAIIWRDTIGKYGVTEQPVTVERIHPEHCWGTPDWWRWDNIEEVLRVADYKYGHRYVEVWDNWQLIAYAAGLLHMLDRFDFETKLELIVVQPRSYYGEGPVRRWFGMADELRAYVNIAKGAVERALMPDPEAHTGPECEFCLHRGNCDVLMRATAHIADWVAQAEPRTMTPEAIGVELYHLHHAAELLNARTTGLEAMAFQMLRTGKRVPYYKVGSGHGRIKWKPDAPVEEVATLGDLLGVELRKPPALITPTQAIDAGVDESIIKQYAERYPGAQKLVQDSLLSVRKLFQK